MAVPRSVLSLFSKNSSLILKSKIHVFFSTSVKKEQPLTVYELLKNKHNFSQQAASHVASVLPKIENPQNSDSLLLFLKENGFSITQLERIMSMHPQCLTARFEVNIKPKITTLQEMGFSAEDISEIVTKNPAILSSSLQNRIIPNISILKGLLGSSVEMAKVLRKFSDLLRCDLEKHLLPNIKFLKSCGVAMEQITSHICSYQRFFLCNPEAMRKFVDKADALGVQRGSKSFLHAVQVLASLTSDNLELKFKAFRDLGFSDDDILKTFRNSPLVFSTSEDKVRKITEVLVGTGKYDMACIVNCPVSFTYSIETRYKPRLHVLQILETKNLIEKWPSLSRLVGLSNNEFCVRFVDPFSHELGDVKLMTVLKSR